MNHNIPHTEDTIDLKELFFSLVTQWKLITLCTMLSLALASLYIYLIPNKYIVNALVEVKEQREENLFERSKPTSIQVDIETLQSAKTLAPVIQNLHLDIQISNHDESFNKPLLSNQTQHLEYFPEYVRFKNNSTSFDIVQFEIPENYLNKNLLLKFNGSSYNLIDTATKKIVFQGILNRHTLNHSDWKVTIFSQGQPKDNYYIKKLPLSTAVNLISSNFSVKEKGKMTRILELTYQGQDKVHITRVLNAILATYNQSQITTQGLDTTKNVNFEDKQLLNLQKQLNDAEQLFYQFRQEHPTTNITKELESYLTEIVVLKIKKIELEQQQVEMANQYTAQHPSMIETKAQLAAINTKLNELNNVLKKLPSLQNQYLKLYSDVQVKSQQLHLAEENKVSNIHIIRNPTEPTSAVKPKKLTILVLALFLGGFLGILLALVRNILIYSGIKNITQIESELNLPVYGAIPRSSTQVLNLKLYKKSKKIPLLALHHNNDIAIECLRNVRTTINFKLSQTKNNIIMISSPTPKVGTSFIASNLAAIIAQNNNRVLLIDADLRCGNLHKYFNLQRSPGLTELLNNQSNLKQITHSTEMHNLSFIGRGSHSSQPSELLSSQKFQALMEQLSSQYDHVIIVTPPVLAVTDGIIVSKYAGINLVVARYSKTQMEELELTLNRFEQAGVKVNGFILNDIQRAAGGYGYNYAYNYKTREKE